MGLQEEVSVSIASPVKTVSAQNLGLQIIIGPSVMCGGRTISVPAAQGSDPAANAILYLGATGQSGTSGVNTVEYAKAKAAFSQSTSPNGAPSTIKLGAMGGAASAVATVFGNDGSLTAGEVIAIINGTTIVENFTTDLSTTMTALAAKMQTALRAQTSGDASSTVVFSSSQVLFTITPKTGVSVFVGITIIGAPTDTLAVSSITYGTTEAYADALARILIADPDQYQITIASTVTADIMAVSAAVNAATQPLFFFYKTADANVVNVTPAADSALGVSGTVAAQILATKAKRTAAFFSGLGQHLDSSIAGYIAGFQPGTYNVAYTQPDGSMTPDALTQTQHNNAAGYYGLVNGSQAFTAGKAVNTLETVGTFDIIRWGTCQDGTSWIDAVIFQDYLVGALQAAVYGVLVNNPKVPYDINGFAMIQAAMESVFKPLVSLPGVTRPITQYMEDVNKKQIGGYLITMPSFTDPSSPNGYVSSADKLARVLNNLRWQCWYSSANNSIHMLGIIS